MSHSQVFKFEDPFRPIYEHFSISVWVAAAVLTFVLDATTHVHSNVFLGFGLFCLLAAGYRGYQAYSLWEIQCELGGRPLGFMDRDELDRMHKGHEKELFLGYGFDWTQEYVQLTHNIRRTDPSKLVPQLDDRDPFKPMGQPWLHGIGQLYEKPIYLPIEHTAGHILLVGTTRAGKSRFLDSIIHQAVRRGESVIIWDPKGDKGLSESLRLALAADGRPDDMVYFHPAYPERSCRIDPLANFNRATELASRIAALIPSETGADPFTAHSMMVLTNLCAGMLMIDSKPTLRVLKRFVDSGVESLLVKCCETYFEKAIPTSWKEQVKVYVNKTKGRGDRELAIAYQSYYFDIVQPQAPCTELEGLISDFNHDKAHQQKMTASLTPVLTMLTAGNLGDLLSPDGTKIDPYDRPINDFENIITMGKGCYMGLDSLSDSMVGSAVGSMFVSDMTAVSGNRYNYPQGRLKPVTLIIDEAAELVSDKMIQLLNKAGGSLVRLVVATQTFADFASRVGSQDKARMVLGNLNNKIVLRTIDGETQEYIADNFPQTYVRHIEYTQATDARTDSPLAFGYRLSEAMKETEVPMVAPDLLGCLPNMEFFAQISAGRIVKGRIKILGEDNRLPTKH